MIHERKVWTYALGSDEIRKHGISEFWSEFKQSRLYSSWLFYAMINFFGVYVAGMILGIPYSSSVLFVSLVVTVSQLAYSLASYPSRLREYTAYTRKGAVCELSIDSEGISWTWDGATTSAPWSKVRLLDSDARKVTLLVGSETRTFYRERTNNEATQAIEDHLCGQA